ncbi:glycosyltransferase family 2 protein [Parvicella tangerina]
MPAYNCEKFVERAILSILEQSYKNFELLIADDKSTDKTRELIDDFSDQRIIRFHNDKNEGYLKTCNKLFEQSTGDFISFQDADDYAHPERFEKLIEAFESNGDLMVAGSAVIRVSNDDEVLGELQFAQTTAEIRQALPKKFECIGSALIVKREVTERFGLYHEFFDRIGSEDLYWFGVVASVYQVKNLSDPLYYYRDNPNSVSRMIKGNVRKIMSKDFAVEGVKYFLKKRKVLFDDKYRSRSLELFLLGKGLCWQKEYRKGTAKIILSIFLNPFYPNSRVSTLKLYLPKLFKN